MRRFISNCSIMLLSILGTVIWLVIVILLEIVLCIAISSSQLFKGKKYGKRRIP
jgi:hypothetical protein